MKKSLKEIVHEKMLQRCVSLLVSAAMLVTSTSAFLDIISENSRIIAHAAGTYDLTTISEIVDYSIEYANGNRNANDILNIAIASTNESTLTQ